MSPTAREVPDTDWHVDELYRFAPPTGATLIDGDAFALRRRPQPRSLRCGVCIRARTIPSCARRARSATSAIYLPGEEPSDAEIAARRATFFDPYHALLAAEIDRVRNRHGHAVLLDGHSIAAEVPRFFAGRLPDLNLGTSDGGSCDRLRAGAGRGHRFGCERLHARRQRPLQGRLHHAPIRHARTPSVHALQLEMAQACYMDEAHPATVRRCARGRAHRSVLERLVIALSEWRPQGGNPMIRVYVARQRYDAYLVADRLNQAGIRAHVFNEHASSIAGDVPPDVAQPHVWIALRQRRAARARAACAKWRSRQARTTPIYCRKCGEQSPGNFELCWNCGHDLI